VRRGHAYAAGAASRSVAKLETLASLQMPFALKALEVCLARRVHPLAGVHNRVWRPIAWCDSCVLRSAQPLLRLLRLYR
jgi:hypothetical protein